MGKIKRKRNRKTTLHIPRYGSTGFVEPFTGPFAGWGEGVDPLQQEYKLGSVWNVYLSIDPPVKSIVKVVGHRPGKRIICVDQRGTSYALMHHQMISESLENFDAPPTHNPDMSENEKLSQLKLFLQEIVNREAECRSFSGAIFVDKYFSAFGEIASSAAKLLNELT